MTAALIPAALYVLPGDSAEDSRGFDLPGGILLGLAAGLFLFGITRGQVSGFGSAGSRGSFAGSALAALGFGWRIRRAAEPFVSQRSSRTGLTSPPLSSGTSACSPTCLRSLFVPLLVSQVNGLSPGQAGLVLTPGAVALAIISPLADGGRIDRGAPAHIHRAGDHAALCALYLHVRGRGFTRDRLARYAGCWRRVRPRQFPKYQRCRLRPWTRRGWRGPWHLQWCFLPRRRDGTGCDWAFLAARKGAMQGWSLLYALDAAVYS